MGESASKIFTCGAQNNDSQGKKRPGDEERRQGSNYRRTLTLEDSEIVIAKLKIQKDRLDARLKKFEDEEYNLDEKIKNHLRNKQKDRALFCVKKKKNIKEFKKKTFQKFDFIDSQIRKVEEAQDDIEFTQTLKHTNQVLKELHEQIDLEEINIAKELQEEGQIKRNMLESMLDDGDQDLENEINQIEAQMMQENFDQAGDMNIQANENIYYNQNYNQKQSRERDVYQPMMI